MSDRDNSPSPLENSILSPSFVASLPESIITRILRRLCDECWEDDRPWERMGWTHALNTCRRWRAAGLATPHRVWARIPVTRPEPMLDMWAARAQPLLLDAIAVEELDSNVEEIESIVVWLVKYASRIRSLRWEASKLTQLLFYFGASMLNLTHLALIDIDEDSDCTLVLKERQYPALRHLTLQTLDLEIPKPLLSITTLELTEMPFRFDATMKAFLSFLTCLPCVEVMHLREASPSLDDKTNPYDKVDGRPALKGRIDLPKLRRLTIFDIDWNCRWLLAHLLIPLSAHVSLVDPATCMVQEYQLPADVAEIHTEAPALHALSSGLSGSPILRLHSELLTLIFMSLLHDKRLKYLEWTVVLEVCREWYAIGCSFSALWTRIRMDNNLTRMNLLVSRAGQLPLDVFIGEDEDIPDVVPLREWLANNSAKICSLSWRGPQSSLDKLSDMLDFTMPKLARLALLPPFNASDVDSESTWRISEAHLPSLSALSLRQMDVSKIPTAGLTKLHLDCIRRMPMMTFLALLESMSDLTDLILCESLPSLNALEELENLDLFNNKTWPRPARTIALCKLRQLRISDTTANTKWFMYHLSSPPLQSLHLEYTEVEVHSEGSEPDQLEFALQDPPSVVSEMLLPLRKLRVAETDKHTIEVFRELADQTPRFTLDVEDVLCDDGSTSLTPMLDALGHLIRGPIITVLEVLAPLVYTSELDDMCWDNVFEALPALECLLIRGDIDICPLFDALGDGYKLQKLVKVEMHLATRWLSSDAIRRIRGSLAARQTTDAARLEELSIHPKLHLPLNALETLKSVEVERLILEDCECCGKRS